MNIIAEHRETVSVFVGLLARTFQGIMRGLVSWQWTCVIRNATDLLIRYATDSRTRYASCAMWGRIRNVIQPTWAPPLFGTLNIIFSLFFRAGIARSHKWTWCCYRPTRMARSRTFSNSAPTRRRPERLRLQKGSSNTTIRPRPSAILPDEMNHGSLLTVVPHTVVGRSPEYCVLPGQTHHSQ